MTMPHPDLVAVLAGILGVLVVASTIGFVLERKLSPDGSNAVVEKLNDRFTLIELRYGFMQSHNVSQALGYLRKCGIKFDIMSTSFYLGRRKLVPDAESGMPMWQDRLFIALANTSTDPSDYFHLPANRVVELGSHVII